MEGCPQWRPSLSQQLSQSAVTLHRLAAFCFALEQASRSRLLEIAFVLVRLDHVACVIVNANHGIM
jgi:hypothetical protein